MEATGRLRSSLRRSLAPVDVYRLPEAGRHAAVLVPLVDGPTPSIVFTKRTEDLSRHPGEISFPGGMRHDEDADLLVTALRETEEELGVPPSAVEVLGALPPFETYTSGTTIAPFVGALEVDPVFTANPGEIAEVFEVSVPRLLDVERSKAWERNGATWWGYVYEVDGHTIWGATARILHEMLEYFRKESS